jgi:hypothetical protein
MSLRSLGFAIGVGSMALVACKDTPNSTLQLDSATVLADGGKKAKPGPVNELPIPKEVVESTINRDHLPDYTGPTGVLEGTVYVTGDPAPPIMGKNFDKCPAAADVYSKAFREGAPRPDGSRPLADTILEVIPSSGYTDAIVREKEPNVHATIANCAYGARTYVMTFGQALEVKNDHAGPLFAPYFENQPSPAVLVATPGGDPVRLYPKNLGRYRMIDRVGNAWLEADVFVIANSVHAVSDVKGHYRIEGVPVGKMTLNAYHPAIEHAFNKELDVKDGVVTTMDVTIPNDKAAVRPPSRNLRPLMQ